MDSSLHPIDDGSEEEAISYIIDRYDILGNRFKNQSYAERAIKRGSVRILNCLLILAIQRYSITSTLLEVVPMRNEVVVPMRNEVVVPMRNEVAAT